MRFLVVTGAAGAGKSTLGKALARRLALPLLDLDTLTNPVLDGVVTPLLAGDHWNAASLRPTVRPARYAALLDTLRDQADVGGGAVAVAPFTAELTGGAAWEALVDACGQRPTVVWISGSAELLAARRADRDVDRDAHAMDADPQPPRVPHLRVAAALSIAAQVTEVLAHLGE